MILKIRGALTCVLLLALTVMAFYACAFLITATVTVAAGPPEIKATRADLAGQVAALRVDALAEIDKQATAVLKTADARLASIERTEDKRLAAIEQDAKDIGFIAVSSADQHMAETTAQLATATSQLAGLRTDLKPALDSIPPAAGSIQALAKDGKDSWDDSYWDVVGLLDSAGVATTQVAQTMQTINKAAPAMAASAQRNADSVAGITSDAHAMTAAMLKPKSVFGKIWAAITVASRFAGLL